MNKLINTLFFRIVFYIFVGLLHCNVSISQNASSQENFDVKFYHLNVKLSDTSTYISGNTLIVAEILSSNDTLVLDLGKQLIVSNVLINGNQTPFYHSEDKLTIISSLFVQNSDVSIVVFYEGDGNDENTDGAIFNKEKPPYGNFTYSLTEPYSTKYWYPCKEVLSDKADSVYVYITVPKHLKAGSNGLLKEIIQIDNEHVQYRWESNYPTAFYLISVAVGDYLDYTFYTEIINSESTLPIVNYIYNSEDFLEEQKNNIDTTAYLINLFSDLFVPYPFPNEKYGHCLAPVGGGMEHQTMTTLGNFGFGLVAHELAHQWFGNFVTCDAWNHIWINEGFASYAEFLAFEYNGDIEAAKSWMEYAQVSAMESTVGSVYVPDNELDNSSRIFDYKSTYKKGAAILHMLRYELNNDELFFEILKEFLNRYSFNVASADDFLNVVNELSESSFNYFFEQWYYGAGYPIFDVEWYQVADTLIIRSNQVTSEPEKTAFFALNMQYKLVYPTGDTVVNAKINSALTESKFIVENTVYDLQVDPENFLLKNVNSIHRNDSLMSGTIPQILLFPNPANEYVRLYVSEQTIPFDVHFYNLSGVRIQTIKNINPTGTEIKLNNLERGVYLLTFDLGDKTGVAKLIKS